MIPDILSPEKRYITEVSGQHLNDNTNENEMYISIENKTLKYFPQGLEKIYKNLVGIRIAEVHLEEIHQCDLQPYTKLISLDFYENEIEVIEADLFKYNPELVVVSFLNNNIFHVDSGTFDNLVNLRTLHFANNNCIDIGILNNDRGATLSLIRQIKKDCVGHEFLVWQERFKTLKKVALEFEDTENFSENITEMETELNNSEFSQYSPFKIEIKDLLNIIYANEDSEDTTLASTLENEV